MNRMFAFLLVAGVSLVSLLLLIFWSLATYPLGNAPMNEMMRQMMGGSVGAGTQAMQGMPWFMWGSIIVVAAIVLVGVFGLGYYLAYPQIRLGPPGHAIAAPTLTTMEGSKMSWSTLLRTSKQDERRVLEVLASHNGTYLQKFIVKESGFSKLRTHRIISRFAERGIVTAVKSGNTNEIKLADWLKETAQNRN